MSEPVLWGTLVIGPINAAKNLPSYIYVSMSDICTVTLKHNFLRRLAIFSDNFQINILGRIANSTIL